MEISTVAVIGAGTMGRGIAQVAAVHGLTVRLVDTSEAVLQQAFQTIEHHLQRQLNKSLITLEQVEAARKRITCLTDIAAAVADVELVIEAVPEDPTLKGQLFAALDAQAPAHAILASNTSSISITWLGTRTRRPEQVIGMHFFNPVPVMRLVEIVRGLKTSQATFEAVAALAQRLDKVPVAVQDAPGFVSNRVLMPMINEAVYCVMEGVASVEDVDRVMQLGMAHPMGPLALADLIGLDVCLAILEVLHRELGEDKYRPCPLLRKMVAAGYLGRKTGRGFYEYPAA
ncbi:3-hydroxyacyl-CoA dehydrogenase family protein [Rhodothermus bifroesti]|uniref:3-hydroxybutyryl-CoA dehydrogenase n=1 Tax=Rhodothermus marinus TaxID=29549 RepID=A0A7V2B0G9_RHOMR|nr:3-hydroxybutyryl-CoA dehydrogenase [Rhodothermus bifroesti]GBD01282.1 putative 3-hydroxybutyryl-CoA dehydrogenase [bacterium HR18]